MIVRALASVSMVYNNPNNHFMQRDYSGVCQKVIYYTLLRTRYLV